VADSTPDGGSPGSGPGTTTPGPYNTPIPGVAEYSQLIALAQKAYTQSVATLNLQRGQLLQQYGYGGKIDPATGMVTHLYVDANNPYGLYQQTLKGYGMQSDQTRQSMALRGIHGGLANQAAKAQTWDFGKTTTGLTNQLQQTLLGIQEQQNQDYYNEQTQIVQAQLQALNQAITMMLSGQNIDPANLAGIENNIPKA
jgi:hypothetical protein